MTKENLDNKQNKMHDKIYKHALNNGLIKQKPFIEPIYDGVADISSYLLSEPKIMWILKEPYDDFTISGKPKGGSWYLTEHLKNPMIWKDLNMWKVMIQINYAIHNNLKWCELDYIEKNKEMAEELKKIAYINVSKMPADTASPNVHMWECYEIWKNILFEQIILYNPDIIIFGYTFQFFKDDLKITDKPISTTSGQWSTDIYRKENMILIDAYHPSRKGGENSSYNYVTSVIKGYKKILCKE
ncbi:hypothetical protein [Treponema sp. C6A8]|uniref:hypothetical protein n=1 Tax=Treponema sp. C6A8 TaxID=1410609 RepID=UPI00048468EB|nr:hypothetical protein [Treponema sp. C6A8]